MYGPIGQKMMRARKKPSVEEAEPFERDPIARDPGELEDEPGAFVAPLRRYKFRQRFLPNQPRGT